MNATLIAHRGAEYVNREQLAELESPVGTETWKPVPHVELVETLTNVIDDRGFGIEREQFAVQGPKLFGTFDLTWNKGIDYGAAVGFRHANDKSMSIQVAVGCRVFVCDNMSFLGELISVRKHTKNLNLAEEMDRVMFRYMQGFRRLQDDIAVRENTLLDDAKVKTLIYDVFERKIVPMKLFGPVSAEYAHVRDDSSVRMTGWWLENLFTNHIKTMQPAPAFRATARLGKFLSSKF